MELQFNPRIVSEVVINEFLYIRGEPEGQKRLFTSWL